MCPIFDISSAYTQYFKSCGASLDLLTYYLEYYQNVTSTVQTANYNQIVLYKYCTSVYEQSVRQFCHIVFTLWTLRNIQPVLNKQSTDLCDKHNTGCNQLMQGMTFTLRCPQKSNLPHSQGLASWLLVSEHLYMSPSSPYLPSSSPSLSLASYLLLTIGLAVFTLAFLGCCGALTTNR